MTIAERVAVITERIADSARAVGRSPSEVTLVAVAKRQPIERIREALEAGITDLGESTAQGLRNTQEALADTGHRPTWHFVGALQRNKVNAVLGASRIIHSVDRASLADALSDRSGADGVEVLVQVNIGREPQKAGVAPEQAVDFACEVAAKPGLRLRGFMALPPATEEPEVHFEALGALSRALQEREAGRGATHLSMGMSEDFDKAIRCGATIVRVGTALFGPRTS